jgi:hypothetical protein
MSQDQPDLHSELQRLRAENAKLRQRESEGAIRLKVSDKGALSVYGLMRFPVTLYREQWMTLLAEKERILEFLSAHDGDLKSARTANNKDQG